MCEERRLQDLPALGCRTLVWDNASFHTTPRVEEFLGLQGLQVLRTPPNSPDLNPIENIISIWKHNVHARVLEWIDGTNEFYRHVVEEEGVKLLSVAENRQRIVRTIASMPRRCRAVIDAHGFMTRC